MHCLCGGSGRGAAARAKRHLVRMQRALLVACKPGAPLPCAADPAPPPPTRPFPLLPVCRFVHDGLVHRRFPVGPIADLPAMKRIVVSLGWGEAPCDAAWRRLFYAAPLLRRCCTWQGTSRAHVASPEPAGPAAHTQPLAVHPPRLLPSPHPHPGPWPLPPSPPMPQLAHQLHHSEKYGGVPFGMFLGPQVGGWMGRQLGSEGPGCAVCACRSRGPAGPAPLQRALASLHCRTCARRVPGGRAPFQPARLQVPPLRRPNCPGAQPNCPKRFPCSHAGAGGCGCWP